ncbi:MAG: hypothetical protein LQ346_005088 [Caloplaca aetnensis]|nr:MAG: hypothetical protein LQ346_005088 [Caloplaca aetnensis]
MTVLGSPIAAKPEDDADELPSYFTWIHTWTAIGDSFAAGIGAGQYPKTHEDTSCSRYGDAYPVMLNDLMEIPQASFNFIACTGAISAEIKDQAKQLALGSQDLLTISAGGNDVGFSTVLKECVYLPSSEKACEAALATASSLVEHELQSNIESLLDSVLPVMKDDAIVVYTLYAQFFNDIDPACNKQSWVLFDPTGRSGKEFGLKLTTQKRRKMNEMVLAANDRIRTAITNKQNGFESRKISIAIVDWDPYVGKIHGRFCEEGATLNPDDNLSLVFQRQDQTPIFVPGDKKITQIEQSKDEVNLPASDGLVRSFLPDSFTRRFHPNTLGQSIIAQIALDQIATAKDKKLRAEEKVEACILYPQPPLCKEDDRTVITHPRFDGVVDDFCRDKADSKVTDMGIGGEGSFSSECGVYSFKITDSTPKFPPGADAVDGDGAVIKPWCSHAEEQFIPLDDLLPAVGEYCDHDGEPFFPGDKQITHTISSGPETHFYMQGRDITKSNGKYKYYKYDDVCE